MILKYLTAFIILGKCGELAGLPEVQDDGIIFENEYKEILRKKTEGDNTKSDSVTPEYLFVNGQYVRDHSRKNLDKGGMPSGIHPKADFEILETNQGWTNSYKRFGLFLSLRSSNDSQGNRSSVENDPPDRVEQISDKFFSPDEVLAIARATEFVGVRPIGGKGMEEKDKVWHWNRKREARAQTAPTRQKRSRFRHRYPTEDFIYFPDYNKWKPMKVSTTMKPTVRPTPSRPSLNIDQCVRSCLTTPEYNPVCGDDGQTYFNPGKLKCTSFCGKKVAANHFGRCKPILPPSLVQGIF